MHIPNHRLKGREPKFAPSMRAESDYQREMAEAFRLAAHYAWAAKRDWQEGSPEYQALEKFSDDMEKKQLEHFKLAEEWWDRYLDKIGKK